MQILFSSFVYQAEIRFHEMLFFKQSTIVYGTHLVYMQDCKPVLLWTCDLQYWYGSGSTDSVIRAADLRNRILLFFVGNKNKFCSKFLCFFIVQRYIYISIQR